MERYCILGKFNTFYDWRLILTNKDIPDAEPKTNLVKLDGMSGSLDLSESLTGEVAYDDRVISLTFWTDYGSRRDRDTLLRTITTELHGKKIKVIEPDDSTHYYYGRVKVKSKSNKLAYAEISLEITCEPWRFAIEESVRRVDVMTSSASVVIHNSGVKTLCPTLTVSGSVNVEIDGLSTDLTTGEYKITNLKLKTGVNIVKVSGSGSVTFTYREADL